MTFKDVRIVHISIAAPPAGVAALLRDARRLPEWAPNFGDEIKPAATAGSCGPRLVPAL